MKIILKEAEGFNLRSATIHPGHKDRQIERENKLHCTN